MSDGFTLIRELRQCLQESTTSTWPDLKTSYDYIYQAVEATNARVGLLTSSHAITSVASQRNYTLNADFLTLYLRDDQNRFYIKYYDGIDTYFIFPSSYDSIVLSNNNTAIPIPNAFCIKYASPITQITGTVSSDGVMAHPYTLFNQIAGETTLNTSTSLTNVRVGDTVHNTTDGSHGIVISAVAGVVICALFDGVAYNYFKQNDVFIINPQQRLELYLDPPPLSSGGTITVPYMQKPSPIYSAYRSYQIPSGYSSVVVQYAAWLYKYRDREPSFGDMLFRNWDAKVRQLGKVINDAVDRKGFGVNFIKRADRSWTYR